MSNIHKPGPGEYNTYFQRYIDLVPEGDFQSVLVGNTATAIAFFEAIPAPRHAFRYADGKWSVKQVLMHMIDTERVMSYRALVAARGDNESMLSSMDENRYADNANAHLRTLPDIIDEFKAVRAATTHLFTHITPAQAILAANTPVRPATTQALGYIIVGHVLHHISVIRERYL